MAKLLYEEESYKIRGACFNVYNVLGGGIQEKIITRALIQELLSQELKIENHPRIDIIYKGKKIGVYVPDIIAKGTSLVSRSPGRGQLLPQLDFWFLYIHFCRNLFRLPLHQRQ